MKKIIWMLVAVLPLMVSCEKKNNDVSKNGVSIVTKNSLPPGMQSFLITHFPDHAISYVVEDRDDNEVEYEVNFTNGDMIEFLGDGLWSEVDCSNSRVPLALIPQEIQTYVSGKYAGKYVTAIEKDEEWDVELNDGTELEFSATYEFIAEESSEDKNVAFGDLPKSVTSFISTHFAESEFEEATLERDEYEIEFTNGNELTITSNGELIEISYEVGTVAWSIVPEAIKTYVKEKYANNSVVEMEKDSRIYEIGLDNGIELLFDRQGNYLGMGE